MQFHKFKLVLLMLVLFGFNACKVINGNMTKNEINPNLNVDSSSIFYESNWALGNKDSLFVQFYNTYGIVYSETNILTFFRYGLNSDTLTIIVPPGLPGYVSDDFRGEFLKQNGCLYEANGTCYMRGLALDDQFFSLGTVSTHVLTMTDEKSWVYSDMGLNLVFIPNFELAFEFRVPVGPCRERLQKHYRDVNFIIK